MPGDVRWGAPLTTGYFSTADGNPGAGGYAFAGQGGFDVDEPRDIVCLEGCPASLNASQACSTGTALCAHVSMVNVAPDVFFGAGIAFSLNQAMTDGGTAMIALPFAATGIGIAYAVTSFPPNGLQIHIATAETTYYATATAVSGTLRWSSFNTKGYDTPPDGVALTAAPSDAISIVLWTPSTPSSTETADFCVTALHFAQ